MGGLFKNIFGGKPWFQSLTAWGLIVIGVSEVFVAQACSSEVALLSAGVCGVLVKGLDMIGGLLVTLGIRKASTAQNTG